MKIQCDCGAKYAFDVSPEMVRQPVRFVCPGCGLDSSERVNALIRQHFSQPAGLEASAPPAVGIAPAPQLAPRPTSAPVPSSPPSVPLEAAAPPPMRISLASATHIASAPEPPVPSVPPVPAPTPAVPRVRLSSGGHAVSAAETPDVKDTRFCSKHPLQRTTSKCRVCEKPMCPKCMELFGYVCSPHCQEKADLQGIEIPVYAGRKSVVERKRWGKIGLVVKLAALLVVALVGVWFWYAWFGSHPHTAFAVRFENEPVMSGASALCGPGQIVFIHGDKLARYDLKTKKEVWRRQLVDRKKIADEAARELKEMQAAAQRGEGRFKIPQLEELIKDMTRSAERELDLHVRGQNIWVAADGKLVRYDWDSGEPRQEVAVGGDFSRGRTHGEEIEWRAGDGAGQMVITRFNLASGQARTNILGEPPKPTMAETGTRGTKGVAGKTNTAVAAKASAVRKAPADAPKKLDPQKLAAQLADAPVAAKIAAPATIATALNQERTMAEIRSQDDDPTTRPAAKAGPDYADHFTFIPTRDGFVQFSRHMIEEKFISHSAMKAPPKKSALDGNLTVTATVDVANELLNEMQRNAGGDQVVENVSRYAVKVRIGDGKNVADWAGEVVGPPALYPLASINAIVAGKTLLVLDKSNKQKWLSTLNYPVLGGGSDFFDADDEDEARSGLGPVVERGDTLYIFDQGVLSAFDVATGNARWRLPSVGISGIYFDDAGMIYVNTTTASPENIKYSKQIDVSDRINAVVLKLDAKTGRELWKQNLSGNLSYLSGQYIYSVAYTGPHDDDDEINPDLAVLGLEKKAYLRIRRINPKNGRIMWEHFQQRGPLDVKIDRNTIQLVFKREVQVLKYLSF